MLRFMGSQRATELNWGTKIPHAVQCGQKKKCNPQEACKNVENCDLTEG